jgi:hypothetical protein
MMLDIQDAHRPIAAEITLSIHMVDGSTFMQELSIDDADGAQAFLDWFRQPGKCKVWTWQAPTCSMLHSLHHAHITAVDIEGYIEPEGRETRWYERLVDRLRLWSWLRRG